MSRVSEGAFETVLEGRQLDGSVDRTAGFGGWGDALGGHGGWGGVSGSGSNGGEYIGICCPDLSGDRDLRVAGGSTVNIGGVFCVLTMTFGMSFGDRDSVLSLFNFGISLSIAFVLTFGGVRLGNRYPFNLSIRDLGVSVHFVFPDLFFFAGGAGVLGLVV